MDAFRRPTKVRSPRILLVNLVGQGFGGLETHIVNLYKQLSARGHFPLILAAAGSDFHKRIASEGLSCHAVRGSRVRGFRHLFPIIFSKLCREYRIQAIHCNNRFEVASALRAGKKYSARVVFNHHVPDQFEPLFLKGIDAVISPGPEFIHFLDQENRTKKLGIKHVQVIPPLFDSDKFLKYRSPDKPAKWFSEHFGISIKPCPIICTIGNMVADLQHKNYPLLFKSMASLIYDQQTPVQAMLVGDGPSRSLLEELARSLNIQDYVHFLGYTSEKVPGVLYHSDMFVLASSKEAFGIVYLEAGLMCKPSVGARNTGAEVMIVHEKTGLLFENSSADSLAFAIKRMACDLAWGGQIGSQAFAHVTQHFSPSVVIEQYEELYKPCHSLV